MRVKIIDLKYRPINSEESRSLEPSGSFKDIFKITQYSIRTIYHWNSPCKICGSTENIEMHHVRHLKDLNPNLSPVHAIRAKLRRKLP